MNFVIQNSAKSNITYASVVKKVPTAITFENVKYLDTHMKAEKGKACYAMNGDANNAFGLF